MKTPSRLMPIHIPEPVTWWKKALAYSVLALMLYILVSAIIGHPWILAIVAVLTVLFIYSDRSQKRKLRKMADERANEGICTFARSFDRKEIDTWIIRAVHDEFKQYMQFPDGTCPLRASDNLEKDLKIDPEDLEDLIPIISQRAGRSLENTDRNPYYGKVTTVGDFVLFINSQPKINA